MAAAVIAGAGALLWLVSPSLPALGHINILIFLVGFVAFFLAIGVPIAFCFGLGALTFLTFTSSVPTMVMIGRIDEGMSSLILLSVPIFVLLGCILDATGMGRAIVEFLASLIGHVRAGMSYVLLGSLFLVSGISGSKVSDMATVAPALFPEMKRRGHKPKEMIALLATGAAMADTVPPSIVLIVLGSVAGVSIAGLFTCGFVIAMVLLLGLAILARWKARGEVMDGIRRAPLRAVGKALAVAAPALVLPFLIRSAVGGGVATATEVSTIAVLYAMIIGMVLYGGIRPGKIYDMLVETAALSGAILIILGTASAMAWALTQTGFAFKMAALVTDLPGGWVTYMLVTIAVFMVLGCVLEGLPAIVLMAPIMFPIAKSRRHQRHPLFHGRRDRHECGPDGAAHRHRLLHRLQDRQRLAGRSHGRHLALYRRALRRPSRHRDDPGAVDRLSLSLVEGTTCRCRRAAASSPLISPGSSQWSCAPRAGIPT